MELEIINPIEFKQWNHQVCNLNGATIFHSSNWAKVLFESYGYKPKYFCTFTKRKLQNVIPAVEISSPIIGKRGAAIPFSDYVNPLVTDINTFKKLFETMIIYGRENKWRSLTFHGGEKYFNDVKPFKSYIGANLFLDETVSSLFKKFKSNTRRNIKKAEKSGMEINIVKSIDGIKDFYKLNCLTRRNHGLPPQPFSFFLKIYTNIIKKNNGFVCLSSYNNKPVAGVVFFIFNKKAIYKYGASDKKFLSIRPNNLVMWHAIKWCIENKIKLLDLGRSEIEHHGLRRFKRSWNSKEKMINYYKYDFKKKRFLTEKAKLTYYYPIFRKMPIFMLKKMGEVLYRHYG